MEGRKCSRKSQRNRMNKSIRYAVKGKRAFEPAGKTSVLLFPDRREGRGSRRTVLRISGKGKKKSGGCAIIVATNLCSRFL